MSIIENIKKFKNNIALVTQENESIDYKSLLNFSEIILKKIKSRSLVFLVCGNNVESIAGYISFLRSDCVITLVDEKQNYNNLSNLIKIYKPEIIFIKKSKILIEGYKLIITFKNFYFLQRKNKNKVNLNDELSLLISTSGSTGSSKQVRISHKNLSKNTKSIVKYLKISEHDNCITTLPMSYVYGLSVINTHIYTGGSIVLNEHSILYKNFWTLLAKHRVSNFAGVPFTYQMLDRINFYNKDLKHIKYLTQAGGKLDKELNKKILKKFCNKNRDFIVMYGATEATARMSYVPKNFSKNKIGSIGIPIPGGKFSLMDENNKEIKKSNKSGELIYSGKNVCLGYANNIQDLSKGDENNGVFRTGDIAKKDKEDFYYIVGRKNRIIKIHGNRINLEELENNLLTLGFESMCKVGKENKIIIYMKEIKSIQELRKSLPNLTNLHPSVFSIKIIQKFPLNKNFKLSYESKILN